MLKSTKLMIAGIGVAIVAVSGAAAFDYIKDRELQKVVDKCMSLPKQKKHAKLIPDDHPSKIYAKENVFDQFEEKKTIEIDASPRCNSWRDVGIDTYDPPELAEINRLKAGLRVKEDAFTIALFVVFLASLPAAWQFLLRRIVDLRVAITGK